MNIAMSTSCFFTRLFTEQAVEQIAKMGLMHCEVFLSSFSEYREEFAYQIRDIQERTGIHVDSVHSLGSQFEPQLFSSVSRQKEDALPIYREVLRAAQIMGAKHYVMHGKLAMKRPKSRSSQYDALTAQCINELSDISQQYGVQLTIENVHWCMYYTPGFGAGIHPYLNGQVGYTLDIKQAIRSGHEVEEYMREMGNRISNVHIDGVLGMGQDAETCLPNQSTYDFCGLRDSLKAIGYDGNIVVETYPSDYDTFEQLQECCEEMKEIFCP